MRPLFTSTALLLALVSKHLAALPSQQRWHWLLGIAILSTVLAAFSGAVTLLRACRDRRCTSELLLMQLRFPFCHVSRLSNGTWFLTEKATGREYRPPPNLPQPRF
jgi:hypothetical protein